MDREGTSEDLLDDQAPITTKASNLGAGTPQARARSNFLCTTTSPHVTNSSVHSTPPYQVPQTSEPNHSDVDAMLASSCPPAVKSTSATRPSSRSHADSCSSVQTEDSTYDSHQSSQSVDRSQNGWLESWRTFSSSRLMILSLGLLVTAPLLHDLPLFTKAGPSILGASAGVIHKSEPQKRALVDGKLIVPRDDSPTDVCNRWSQQSALVNGTIYLYGGRATTDPSQTTNEWNNDFLTIDVTKSWDISSPVISGLPQPSGPPPVANGYLWNSYESLYLYGGEFQDKPETTPVPYSLWEYNIASSTWIEHQNPKTSSGNNSDGGNLPVLGIAEGAGVSVPELGRGYYFGGHQDYKTTAGWSIDVSKIYLKSLLEFTYPGYTNNGVKSLSGGKTAGDDGVWRNITQGGIQDTATFPNRADSVLIYVPGYGPDGILVNMGGGNNQSFTQMNVIDVYDIASSTWYKQATTGKYPILRVNPCAVAASAPDGSSTNVYMYGGQNLIPFENQTQYSDTWILTIPSFTWIEVDTSGQSVPPGRTGHTCNIWNGQIIVVGGYTGPQTNGLGCDSGFYVFDATNLEWQNKFNAISEGGPPGNIQNQQAAQAKDPLALSGSYGYQVPGAVQSVIGGKGTGGATITAPAQSATAGPLATGKPVTYTVTGPNGATVTETGTAVSGSNKGSGGPNVAAIVAGVVAGCFAVLAAYLAFCAFIYRRQLKLYKNHVAMTQRAAAAGGEKTAFLTGVSSTEPSRNQNSTDQSSRKANSQNGSTPASSGWGPVPPLPGGAPVGGNSTANSSNEDLVYNEPSFVGVLLNPRRSLRVVNRD
ncbi:hypothetical protein ACLMJK_000427 [Lecanora helva]